MTDRYVGMFKRGYARLFKRPEADTNARFPKQIAAEPTVSGGPAGSSPVPRLPVILISYNRGPMLRKVVDGYQRQSVPVDIFVHDNGSDDPGTRAVLAQLEAEGVVVFHRPKISSPEELNLVDETVQAVFQDRPPSAYAVSDCDVSIAESSPTTLQAYLDVLQAMPDVECAGPMLRIDDVPPSYSLYNAMLNRHISAFWSKEPEWAEVNGRRLAFQRAPIDTTLAVYRAGEPFRRLRRGVRLYHPYDARHLDWYPEEHAAAYRTSADGSTISNWSNPARERASQDVALKHRQYRAVVEAEDGSLIAVTKTIGTGVARQDPDILQTLMESVRAALLPSWAEAIGRAWVWRGRAGVQEVTFGPSDRLAFDVVPQSGDSWALFAVARTDVMHQRLHAAGLRKGSDGRRYALGTVAATDGGATDSAVIADRLDQTLSRLARQAGHPERVSGEALPEPLAESADL
jgi:hypothetical protein